MTVRTGRTVGIGALGGATALIHLTSDLDMVIVQTTGAFKLFPHGVDSNPFQHSWAWLVVKAVENALLGAGQVIRTVFFRFQALSYVWSRVEKVETPGLHAQKPKTAEF